MNKLRWRPEGNPRAACSAPTAAIELRITLRVVAHQHFAEGGVKGFDMRGEIFAVFEIEFFLPALFRGAGELMPCLRGIAKNGRAELLVDQNAGLGRDRLRLRAPTGNRRR